MHGGTVYQTGVHEPGKEADLEGSVFPGFVLSGVHSLRHPGDGVCCRRSCAKPLRHSRESPFSGENVFPEEEELHTYGFNYKGSCEGARYYVRHEQLHLCEYVLGTRSIVASVNEEGGKHLFLLKMRFYDQQHDESSRLYPYCTQEILSDFPVTVTTHKCLKRVEFA
ncbi:MAG: hypothetical protein LUE13_04165 [Akkermansiaceae bacterium]|nr:hypothetical protein [Akkermansiaceae bacterium]